MPNVEELLIYLTDIIQDPSYDEDMKIKYLNKNLRKITSGIKIPDEREVIISPAFPDLFYINESVWTSPTLAYINLPTNYQRDVTFVANNSNGMEVELYNSFVQMTKNYPRLNSAVALCCCSVLGRKLYYQGIVSKTVTSAATISFVASTKTIADSAKGLAVSAGMIINVDGSTSNDGNKTVVSVAADYSSCVVSEALVNESLGEDVIITKGEQLTVHYFRYPTLITGTSQTPDGIPDELQVDILVNITAADIYNLIEDGIEGLKVNTKKCSDLGYAALKDYTLSTPAEGRSLHLWPVED
jgi:hypothetical protein